MLAKYKTRTNIGVGIGIAGFIAFLSLRGSASPGSQELGLAIGILSLPVYIWGCVQYAKAKGHSGWFGLLGILSLLGLIVLAILPDRHKAVRS